MRAAWVRGAKKAHCWAPSSLRVSATKNVPHGHWNVILGTLPPPPSCNPTTAILSPSGWTTRLSSREWWFLRNSARSWLLSLLSSSPHMVLTCTSPLPEKGTSEPGAGQEGRFLCTPRPKSHLPPGTATTACLPGWDLAPCSLHPRHLFLWGGLGFHSQVDSGRSWPVSHTRLGVGSGSPRYQKPRSKRDGLPDSMVTSGPSQGSWVITR